MKTILSASMINEAYKFISANINLTPVLTSSYLNSLANKRLYFKCENFQKTGSFKARGALYSVLRKFPADEQGKSNKYKGCVTHSSGNHGQAVAWACQIASVPCTIVLPDNTPSIKSDAVRGYKSEIEFCDKPAATMIRTADRIATENSYIRIDDDMDLMLGQGTVAYELLEEVPHLNAIICSVSCGGLISGMAVYCKSVKPSLKLFAVEPVGKRLATCLRTNTRNLSGGCETSLETKAEALRMNQVGVETFPIIQRYVEPDDVFTVTDEEMIAATNMVFKRMKLVVELSAGMSVFGCLCIL